MNDKYLQSMTSQKQFVQSPLTRAVQYKTNSALLFNGRKSVGPSVAHLALLFNGRNCVEITWKMKSDKSDKFLSGWASGLAGWPWGGMDRLTDVETNIQTEDFPLKNNEISSWNKRRAGQSNCWPFDVFRRLVVIGNLAKSGWVIFLDGSYASTSSSFISSSSFSSPSSSSSSSHQDTWLFVPKLFFRLSAVILVTPS